VTDKQDIERRYLIRKGAFWYRPNCQGYTDSAIQAGRYTLEEAERYTHPNGKNGPRDDMSFTHEDDVKCPDWRAFAAKTEHNWCSDDHPCAVATALTAQRDEAVAALRKYGEHRRYCAKNRLTIDECDCGFTAALAKLETGQ